MEKCNSYSAPQHKLGQGFDDNDLNQTGTEQYTDVAGEFPHMFLTYYVIHTFSDSFGFICFPCK